MNLPLCHLILSRILACAATTPRLMAALQAKNLIPRTAIPVDRSSGDGPFAGQGDGVQLP